MHHLILSKGPQCSCVSVALIVVKLATHPSQTIKSMVLNQFDDMLLELTWIGIDYVSNGRQEGCFQLFTFWHYRLLYLEV